MSDELRRECETFARYLVGEDPLPVVMRGYLDHHARFPFRGDAFDARTVRQARRGGLRLRLADAWVSRFRRTGVLRKKLVLMLALLECTARHSEPLDEPSDGGPWRVGLGLVLHGAAWSAALAAAAVWLGPLQLFGRGGEADV